MIGNFQDLTRKPRILIKGPQDLDFELLNPTRIAKISLTILLVILRILQDCSDTAESFQNQNSFNGSIGYWYIIFVSTY